MKTKGNSKADETGEQAIQAARRAQLQKEVSKRMDRPGASAEAVKVQVVRLGFSPDVRDICYSNRTSAMTA